MKCTHPRCIVAQAVARGPELGATCAGRSTGRCERRCSDRRAALAAVRHAAAAYGVPGAAGLTLVHHAGAPPTARMPSSRMAAQAAFVPPCPSGDATAACGWKVAVGFELAIAHSRGRAIAAVAPTDRRIGVDLEREASVQAGEAPYFLGRGEASEPLGPTTLWTLKEAAWKALRLTPDIPFGALRLELSPGGELRAVAFYGESRAAVATIWHPWRGWVAALVELLPPSSVSSGPAAPAACAVVQAPEGFSGVAP